MALGANSYGSTAGVAAYVRHLLPANTSDFSPVSRPTLAEVEAFLDRRSALLNGWLAQAGYSVPVTQADALLILASYANLGAAGDCELTQRAGGYDAEDANRRENKFLEQFGEARDFILSGALTGLGVPQRTSTPQAGFYVGGKRSTGEALKPIFTRRGMANDPTAESTEAEP